MGIGSPWIVATDLDRTLLWPESLAGAVCVEHLDGRPLSHLSRTGLADVEEILRSPSVVVVTTRSPEQLARLRLPIRGRVLALNGAVLLEAGVPDADHDSAMRTVMGRSSPIGEVTDRIGVTLTSALVRGVRSYGEAYLRVLLHRGVESTSELSEDLCAAVEPLDWRVVTERRRIYLLPSGLTKGAALRRVADRAEAVVVAAAGDSVLDASMLDLAGEAVVPRDSTLVASGWSHPRLTVTEASGLAGCEEVAARLRAVLGEQPPATR